MSEKKITVWQGKHIEIQKTTYGKQWVARGEWKYFTVEHRVVPLGCVFGSLDGDDRDKTAIIQENVKKPTHEGKLPKEELEEWIADLKELDKRFPELWDDFVVEYNKKQEIDERKRKKREQKERAEERLERASGDLLRSSQMALEYILDGEIDEKVVIRRLKAAIKKARKQ